MAKERYQTRLPADKAEELEQFKNDRDISTAEAVRRLVDRGLEQTGEGQPAETVDDLDSSQRAGVARARERTAGADLDGARRWFADPLNTVVAVLLAAFAGTVAAQAGMTAGAAIRDFVAILGGI